MPVIIAALVRAAIQMAVTLGLIEAGTWLLNRAIVLTMKLFGATEQQAQDIIANSWLQGMEQIAVGAVALKTKIPTKVSERLGFTSKGFNVRTSVLGKIPVVRSLVPAAAPTVAEKAVAIAEAATAVAATGRSTFQTVQGIASIIVSVVGIPVGVGLLITNTIDFGAWNSSAYQGTFQKLLAFFGLEADQQYVKAKVLSPEMSAKILAVYTQQGATGIKDPRTGELLPFNRDNFVAVADFIGAEIIYEQGSVSTKQMMGALTALVVMDANKARSAAAAGGTSSASVGGTSGVKVFTGLVSQGRLGAQLSFMPRPDDLIESTAELQDAAQNNLASFLTTLPGRVIYELKIVSSVTTKDGFRQVGSRQQVQVGTDALGNPKYKTVVNKFAVLVVYVLTESGSRSKIGQIILGPTNAATFNPATQTLVDLERAIQSSVFTSDLNDIRAFETSSGDISVQQTSSQTASPAAAGTAPTADGGVAPAAPSAEQQPAGHDAQTLYDWFTARGLPLPSVKDRSLIYEQQSLGQAAFYTGTAEQNTKLLAALKVSAQPKTVSAAPATALASGAALPRGATRTYYNNGLNGTEREVYGAPSYAQNREYDKKVGALISNPSYRDIPGNLVPDFYRGNITLEELEAAIKGTPIFDPNIGPQIDYGQGKVPFVAP